MDVSPRIVSSDRLRDGVVIVFDDGKTALYSAAVLYAALVDAEDLGSAQNLEDE